MHNLILRPQQFSMGNLKSALGMVCCTVLGALSCFGQPSSLTPLMSAQQQVKWTSGPITASLGTIADMEIPQGYRLTDAEGGRILLERMKNPVPRGLVGILTPESGAWLVVLEFAETGYLKTSADERINSTAILQTLWTRIESQNKLRTSKGAAPITSVNWELTPEFNAADHLLESALRVETQTDKVVNQSVRLLGRKGVLMATVVRAVKTTPEMFPLKELMKGVAFKAGQRYDDYQAGDKLASVGIFQLLTGDDQATAPARDWASKFDRPTMIWIVSGLAVCVLAVVGYLVTKEILSTQQRESFPAPSIEKAKARSARRAANQSDALRGKRTFDYQRFYSDMMMQVSSRTYTGTVLKKDKQTSENEGEISATTLATLGAVTDAQRGAASELIARQKDFIEEQRRLMLQQTKLIEERSKLIEEKNQLLAKQSEMIENQVL